MENGDLGSPQSQAPLTGGDHPTYAEAFPPLSSMGLGPVGGAVNAPVVQPSRSAWPVRSIPQSTVTQVRVCVCACVCVCARARVHMSN